MATIVPFKGIRPAADKVHLVASRTVDNYSRADLNDKLRGNPYTFLHVIHPDLSDGQRTKPGSPERLRKVKAQYRQFHKEGIFVRDPGTCYYIYRQQKQGNTYTGIIGCSSIDDYFNGTIKIHEQTLSEREKKLKDYLEICDFNAEPVLFCYPDDAAIDKLTAQVTARRPEYDFTTTDRVRHTLWVVSDEKEVGLILERFGKLPAVYIADGHHRSASSALLGKSRREKNPGFTGKEPWNYYLGIFFPETQLKIYDFNRVVNELNGLSDDQFLEKVGDKFTIENKGETTVCPQKLHEFGMYLSGNWYLLTPKKGVVNSNDPAGSLDASILTQHILSPVLDIHDLRTDKRVGFVSGIKGLGELKNQVDNWNFSVGFALYPVSMQQLKHIADTNSIMPPKTTYVEPKMRSGLVIYSLED
ncbi:MAG: hypothetical protein FD123_3764 [Bacteroidetes bacterium]|nr:MAG: hypothetical protein FD123_3764 [Bacteroidota bacterium]